MTGRPLQRARVHSPGDLLEVRPYDFESPELIGGDARARLDDALEAFGRALGTLVTAKTRAVVDIATAPAQIQSFGAFVASAEGAVLWATALVGGGRAVYRIPLAEARYWAARMIGAAADRGDADRALTPIERALVRHAVEEHLAELAVATGGLIPEPVLESFGAEPSASLDQDALAVVLPVDAVRRGTRRRLGLALDVDVVLERLGAVAPRQDAAEVAARLGQHLALAPVEIALRFEPTPLRPEAALDLAVGDLVPLAHLTDRPLTIALDGEPLLHAAVGADGERLACIVVDSNGDVA